MRQVRAPKADPALQGWAAAPGVSLLPGLGFLGLNCCIGPWASHRSPGPRCPESRSSPHAPAAAPGLHPSPRPPTCEGHRGCVWLPSPHSAGRAAAHTWALAVRPLVSYYDLSPNRSWISERGPVCWSKVTFESPGPGTRLFKLLLIHVDETEPGTRASGQLSLQVCVVGAAHCFIGCFLRGLGDRRPSLRDGFSQKPAAWGDHHPPGAV